MPEFNFSRMGIFCRCVNSIYCRGQWHALNKSLFWGQMHFCDTLSAGTRKMASHYLLLYAGPRNVK